MRLELIRSRLSVSAYSLIFLLLVVWQIPSTIALRYGLLGLLFPIALALLSVHGRSGDFYKKPSAPFIWLVSLTGWMMFVIYFLGQNPGVSWGELRGQWFSALAAGVVGFLLAKAACRGSAGQGLQLLMVVFWSLLIQVLIHDVLGALYWWSTGEIPFRQAPVLYLPDISYAIVKGAPWYEAFTREGPDKFSYVNNVLGTILVAEVAQRILLQKRWLSCSNAVLGIALGAMLLCSYWLQMRNGNVGLLLLLTLAALMMMVRLADRFGKVQVISASLGVMAVLFILGFAMIRSDPRWQKLEETIPIALDTQTNRSWLVRENYPKTASGDVVDISAYERLAWVKEGLKLVLDNPWGTGYNRLAFGVGIDRKYHMNDTYRAHAHSGIIDFTIANGLVGLALWLCFLGALFYGGLKAFRGEQVGLGLALMFLISGFMGRSIVDSNMRDHILQQFFFLAMLFYGLTACGRRCTSL